MLRSVRLSLVVAVAAVSVWSIWGPVQKADALTCTFNNATSSFGGSYSRNLESSQTAAACTSAKESSAARVSASTLGRSAITAPNIGDFKFLMKADNSTTSTAPTVAILLDNQVEMFAFPDPTIAAPTGGGCDDFPISPSGTTGITPLEDNLHRDWPLFGQTYYYGDYNANPPNDPDTVTSASSPYKKWTPFSPTKAFRYNGWTPTTASEGGGSNGSHPGWYPSQGGDTVSPMSGSASSTICASLPGMTSGDLTTCNACLAKRGYYLRDSSPGDLKNSVFMGSILNDYPPAYIHGAWAYGFIENYSLSDSTGLNPSLAASRSVYQTQTASCNESRIQSVAGFYPTCAQAYKSPGGVYDWANFKSITSPWNSAQEGGEGKNQTWGSYTSGMTPAGDYLSAVAAVDTQRNVCNKCQTFGVIYIGFGIACGETRPGLLSSTTLSPACTGECAPVCSAPLNTSCSGGGNYLAEAAHYAYSIKNIRGYFIGMGPHTGAMRRAAAEGHGRYFDGKNVTSFHDALLAVFAELISQAAAGSVSTINAVQVSVAGQEELLPRFVAKADQGQWEGHLFKYYLFSEFAANCSSFGQSVPVPNPQQPVCNASCVCAGGSCGGRWLVDADCSLISPSSSGFLYKSTWNGSSLVTSATSAVPVWDLYSTIRNTNWYERPAYVAIDTNGDGRIDASDGDGASPDGMYSLTRGASAPSATTTAGGDLKVGTLWLSGGVSDAVADAVAPYLGLGDGGSGTICTDIENQIGTITGVGASIKSGALRVRACARVVLNFALGQDLFNESLLTVSSTNGYLLGNRITMLGDIFHSAPQNIGPPMSETDCSTNGRRCVTTLFNQTHPTDGLNYQALEYPAKVANTAGALVDNPGGIDAYQAYYLDETFRNQRPQVILFGGNDGFVHAVQSACFVGVAADGSTPVYWDGAGHGGCPATTPNGTELWAFAPADLLPGLARMLSGQHTYFADSSPMVRDIYAPDTLSKKKRYTVATPAAKDYKRVAIFGEREGGTHWFGLDVTDPTRPSFRWLFPQPHSEDELRVGQSWGDWVPGSPPIVPIRMSVTSTDKADYPSYLDSSGTAQPFREQWVVLLPGGYDAFGTAGKRIYMLDAWSGGKVYETKNFRGGPPQDFPFAALPAAVAWGSTQVAPATTDYNKGYFDTALYGDQGGQMWTLRFNDVGQGSPVGNWAFGRAFEQYAADDTTTGVKCATGYQMKHRTPVFSMVSAARMPGGNLRAFIGTGDRPNAAEADLGKCSVYNPLACGKGNCALTMAVDASMGGNTGVSGVSSYSGTCYVSTSTESFSSITPAGGTCSPNFTDMNACVSCAGGASLGGTASSTVQPQYACTYTATGWECAFKQISDSSATQRLEATPSTFAGYGDSGYYSRFVAYNVFGPDGSGAKVRALFNGTSTAIAYDDDALTETDLVNLFASSTNARMTAASSSVVVAAKVDADGTAPGYYFYYPAVDERTAGNSVLLQNCVSWYTIQPGQECETGADCPSGSCNTTKHVCNDATAASCGSANLSVPVRQSFLYQVNATDGSSSCGLTGVATLRTAASTNAFLVPPPPPQELVSKNASGQLQFTLVTPADQLSPVGSAISSESTVPFSFFYSLELPRELEQCRHAATATACF